jgi:hypothetical protein
MRSVGSESAYQHFMTGWRDRRSTIGFRPLGSGRTGPQSRELGARVTRTFMVRVASKANVDSTSRDTVLCGVEGHSIYGDTVASQVRRGRKLTHGPVSRKQGNGTLIGFTQHNSLTSIFADRFCALLILGSQLAASVFV